MRKALPPIIPVAGRFLLLLAMQYYFASAVAAEQARASQCEPVSQSAGNPCQSGQPYGLAGSEPSLNLGAGNPVNLATGNKYQEAMDFPPQAGGLALLRSYNAQDSDSTSMGHGWRHSFDIRLRRLPQGLRIIQADGSSIPFHSRTGRWARAVFDAHGALELIRDGWVWHWPDHSTITFDTAGRPTLLRIRGNHIQLQYYGPGSRHPGQVREVRDAAGRQLFFHYRTSAQDRPLLIRVTTPDGTLRYGYDALDRLVAASNAKGATTHYFYEPDLQSGHPYALTGISLETAATGPAPSRQRISDTPSRRRTWRYDDHGRVSLAIRHDLPTGPGTQHFRYPSLASPFKRGVTIIRDGNDNVTKFTLRMLQDRYVLEAVDGYGCAGCPAPGLRAEYDAQGRLLRLNHLRLTRNAQGMPIRLRIGNTGWPDLSLRYDDHGRLTAWASALTGSQHIRYASSGQPVLQAFANGTRWSYRYDGRQRIVAMDEALAQGPAVQTRLQYRDDSVVLLDHPNERQVRATNIAAGNWRLQVTRALARDNPYPVNYEDKLQSDPRARRTVHALPEGGSLHYEYGAQGTLQRIFWQDAANSMHPVAIRNADGGWTAGNRVHTAYRRPQAGRSLVVVKPPTGDQTSGSVPPASAATATPVPAILALERHTASNGLVVNEDYYFFPTRQALRRNYLYDQRMRLAGASEQTFRYRQRQYGKRPLPTGKQQLWYAWQESGAGIAHYDGRRTHRSRIRRDPSGLPLQADGFALEYGANRRLQSVRRDGKLIATYRHNALAQRITKQTAAGFTHFYYLHNRIAGEWFIPAGSPRRVPQGGAISRRYIYAGGKPIAFIDYPQAAPFSRSPLQRLLSGQTGALYFIHTDITGLPLAVTDAQAKPVWLGRPDPAGTLTPLIEQIRLPLRYPGQYADAETGWHDNRYRTYDPHFGHYLEPDPIGPVPGNQPLGYAAQQPRRFTDPLGLLLFAFDGTNDQGEETNSNVYKLQALYDNGPVSYIGGPGTRDARNALRVDPVLGAPQAQPADDSWLASLLHTLRDAGAWLGETLYSPIAGTQSALDAIHGWSVAELVVAQVRNLDYQLYLQSRRSPGPVHAVIDLLGFSRGATAARIFANVIMQRVRQGQYHSSLHRPATTAGRPGYQTEPITACLDFRFMGLFETVPQLGLLGSDNGNAAYDYTVSPAWGWVAHAVALNEHNNLLPVSLIGESPDDNFNEVGFLGNHSDIGGATQKDDLNYQVNPRDEPGDLGDIALQWMHAQARLAGVRLHALPARFRQITNPLVHNNRMFYEVENPSKPQLDKDREIQAPGTNRGPMQHLDPHFGRIQRMEVERFIQRDLPWRPVKNTAPIFADGMPVTPEGAESHLIVNGIVGQVDLQGYAKWLKETTGWRPEIGPIW